MGEAVEASKPIDEQLGNIISNLTENEKDELLKYAQRMQE